MLKDFSLSPKAAFPFLALGVLAWTGCGGDDGGPAGGMPAETPAAAQPMAEEVQDFVDQGNEAQRPGDFEEALSFYRQAMELDSEHPVPQFGALMAAMAIGDESLADSLTEKLKATSPDLLAMLQPAGGMGGGAPGDPHAGGVMPSMPPPATSGEVEGLPAGHPVLYELAPDSTQPDTARSH